LGLQVMQTGEAIFDDLRQAWARQLGSAELETLETQLKSFVGGAPIHSEAPGCVALHLD
jgi:hypothetical protein